MISGVENKLRPHEDGFRSVALFGDILHTFRLSARGGLTGTPWDVTLRLCTLFPPQSILSKVWGQRRCTRSGLEI
jgi:hypothetical protein